jgi:hypothetical protein
MEGDRSRKKFAARHRLPEDAESGRLAPVGAVELRRRHEHHSEAAGRHAREVA